MRVASRPRCEQTFPEPGAARRPAQASSAPTDPPAPPSSPRCRPSRPRTGAINLGQGFPDEDGPRRGARGRPRRRSPHGVNQYPPGRGIPDLLAGRSPSTSSASTVSASIPAREVLVTAGATEALAATLLALIDGPDDEVVVFEPYYDSYAAVVALAGARLVTVPLRWPDFQPDLDELRAAVTDRTRVILVNDPHNPTGAVFTAEVRDEVVRLADRHDAMIVTDEVYEHLVFDGAARADRDAARRVGAHAHDLVGRQDLLDDRLEDRLDHRPRRPRRRRAGRQAVPHLRERRAVPARDRDRAAACPTRSSRGIAATLARQARPARRGPARGRFRRSRRPRARTSRSRMPHPSGATDAADVLPRAPRARGRRRRSRSRRSCTPDAPRASTRRSCASRPASACEVLEEAASRLAALAG